MSSLLTRSMWLSEGLVEEFDGHRQKWFPVAQCGESRLELVSPWMCLFDRQACLGGVRAIFQDGPLAYPPLWHLVRESGSTPTTSLALWVSLVTLLVSATLCIYKDLEETEILFTTYLYFKRLPLIPDYKRLHSLWSGNKCVNTRVTI